MSGKPLSSDDTSVGHSQTDKSQKPSDRIPHSVSPISNTEISSFQTENVTDSVRVTKNRLRLSEYRQNEPNSTDHLIRLVLGVDNERVPITIELQLQPADEKKPKFSVEQLSIDGVELYNNPKPTVQTTQKPAEASSQYLSPTFSKPGKSTRFDLKE